jgi:hypothetical protein
MKGLNEGIIVIDSNGGYKEIMVKAFLLQSSPVLSLSTTLIDFGEVSSDEEMEDYFSITNAGESILKGEISTEEDWIGLSDFEFSLENNEEMEVSIFIDPTELSHGKHTGWIDIVSNGGEETVKVTIDITEKVPILYINTTEVDFGSVELGSQQQEVIMIKNTGGGTLIGTIQSYSSFLAVYPQDFSLEEGRTQAITITLDSSLCSVGKNHGSVVCKSNDDSKEIRVTVDRQLIHIELIIGKDIAVVNGEMHSLPYPPIIMKGRTLVPLRFLAESMKITVEWDQNIREISLKSSTKVILLQIDNRIARVIEDGKSYDTVLDIAPIIRNSTTLIPLRFVSENMNATVEYEAKTQKITVER